MEIVILVRTLKYSFRYTCDEDTLRTSCCVCLQCRIILNIIGILTRKSLLCSWTVEYMRVLQRFSNLFNFISFRTTQTDTSCHFSCSLFCRVISTYYRNHYIVSTLHFAVRSLICRTVPCICIHFLFVFV